MHNIQTLPPSRRQETIPRLLEIWEASVRATHDFLTGEDIDALRPLVEQTLTGVKELHLLCESGEIQAFLGVEGSHIEMLFVHPDHRGGGVGKRLVRHAVDTLGARTLDVNEQNPQAVGFYQHMGFHTVSRSAVDGQGNPFPLLHMALGQG